METIINYLDNIFKTLPQTEEMLRVKNELQSDMEAKYNDLIQKDKTENEVVGIVIEEFGDIDELLYEMGIQRDDAAELPLLDFEAAKNFLSYSIKNSALVSLGVTLIISVVAIMLAMQGYMGLGIERLDVSLLSYESILPVIVVLLMTIPSIGIFIYTDGLSKKYEFIKQGKFSLDNSSTNILKEKYEAFVPKKTGGNIIGVGLCISALFIRILFSNLGEPFTSYVFSITLLIIAVAVFLFIYFGEIESAYEQLLKLYDYAPEKRKERNKSGVKAITWSILICSFLFWGFFGLIISWIILRIVPILIDALSSFIWPIVICIFLIWGFLFDGWMISWILFPVVAIFFGGVGSIIWPIIICIFIVWGFLFDGWMISWILFPMVAVLLNRFSYFKNK